MKFTMNIHHVLFLCFFSGAMGAISIFRKSEGETLSVGCSFNSRQGPKFFTKIEQKQENILIKSSDATFQSGKYSINYDPSINLFYVRISQLHKSDSGRYRCGLGNSSFSKSYSEFEVRVADGAMCNGNTTHTSPETTVCTEAEGGSIRLRCSFSLAGFFDLFFCKDGCKKQDVLVDTKGFTTQRGRYRIEYEKDGVFYVTIANLTKSDSGLFRCGVNIPSSLNPCQAFEIRVTDTPRTSEPISTLLPFTSVASAYKPTMHTCTPSTAFPEITTQSVAEAPTSVTLSNSFFKQQTEETKSTGFITPVVVCLMIIVVLLVVILLVIYQKKRTRNYNRPDATESIECATY